MTHQDQRNTLMQLLEAAVASANPRHCVPPHLPQPPSNGKLIIIAVGKGASAMVQAAEDHYLDADIPAAISGCAVTHTDLAQQPRRLEMLKGGHPVPDQGSAAAAARALELARSAKENDLVLVLLSGGASALWSAPVDGVTLAEKQHVTRALLASGAPISEINCVRKHLSKIKGGGLARAAAPARVITLAISDVPHDDISAIGSGPTVGDPTSLSDARKILSDRTIKLPPSVAAALTNQANETLLPDDPLFDGNDYILVARPYDALKAAEKIARQHGYEVRLLGDSLEGEARELARDHARMVLESRDQSRRTALLSGGEVTVTLTGNGKGGPNQEYALALAIALNRATGVCALAADTDGTDGGTGLSDDPAGAIIDPETLARAEAHGLNPVNFLQNNDSTGFFAILDDLLITGPTQTNVNDFRVILVDS